MGTRPPTRLGGTVLQRLPLAVLAVDAEHRISFANPAALRLLRRSLQECLGQPAASLLVAGEALTEAIAHATTAGSERRIEAALVCGAQAPRRVAVVVAPGGQPRRPELVAILHLQALAEVLESPEAAPKAISSTSLGELVAGFAHELRNPLAAMQGLAESLVAEMAEDDPRSEYGKRLVGLVQRIETLVRACLVFGNPAPPARQPCDAQALLEGALLSLAPRWNGRRPELSIEVGTPRVEADRRQATECLRSLIDNALDAAGEEGRVQVRVSGDDATPVRVHFEIRDQGPGIPADRLEQIFKPFFSTKPKATGLGLPTVRVLAAQNGGQIKVHSAPGDTVFTLILPGAHQGA